MEQITNYDYAPGKALADMEQTTEQPNTVQFYGNPLDYKYIRAWGKMMGSLDSYINDQQIKAYRASAPLTAIYYDNVYDRWVTFIEIKDEELTISGTRNSVLYWLEH